MLARAKWVYTVPGFESLKLGEMPQTPAEQYQLGGNEGGRIVSSPWPADGVIYVGCDNGTLYAIQ